MKQVELLIKNISEIDTNYANSKKSFWKQNEQYTNHINEKISIVNQFELPSELDELERLIDYCNSNIEILTVQIKDEIVYKTILQSYKIALDYLANRALKKIHSDEDLSKKHSQKQLDEKNYSHKEVFDKSPNEFFATEKQKEITDKKNTKKGCAILIGVFIVFSMLFNMCSGYDEISNENDVVVVSKSISYDSKPLTAQYIGEFIREVAIDYPDAKKVIFKITLKGYDYKGRGDKHKFKDYVVRSQDLKKIRTEKDDLYSKANFLGMDCASKNGYGAY